MDDSPRSLPQTIELPSIGDTQSSVRDYVEQDPATFFPVERDERAQCASWEGGWVRAESTSNISRVPAWNGLRRRDNPLDKVEDVEYSKPRATWLEPCGNPNPSPELSFTLPFTVLFCARA